MVRQAVKETNSLQLDSQETNSAFERGEQVPLTDVVLKMQKASSAVRGHLAGAQQGAQGLRRHHEHAGLSQRPATTHSALKDLSIWPPHSQIPGRFVPASGRRAAAGDPQRQWTAAPSGAGRQPGDQQPRQRRRHGQRQRA
jgi:hypothetical protein